MTLLTALLVMQAVPQAGAAQTDGPSIKGPTHSVSRPTPSIMSAGGRIAEVDLEKKSPVLKIVEKEGALSWTVVLNRKTAVWQKGRTLKLTDLKKGQRIKLRYTEKRGRRSARSIEIL